MEDKLREVIALLITDIDDYTTFVSVKDNLVLQRECNYCLSVLTGVDASGHSEDCPVRLAEELLYGSEILKDGWQRFAEVSMHYETQIAAHTIRIYPAGDGQWDCHFNSLMDIGFKGALQDAMEYCVIESRRLQGRNE